jgi:hypothetical protein
MKHFYLTLLLTLFASITYNKVFAYDIAVQNEDGVTIYYNYYNEGTELEVTYYYYNSYWNDFENYYTNNVAIPATVTYMNRTRKVTSIGSSAFKSCTGLTSITIPESVTSIGEYAFKSCTGLTSITIPESVTSIGANAFDGCSGLTSVAIPESVTSIGEYAFIGCGLTKVIVSDIAAWCNISFGVYSNPLESAHHLYSDENTEITDLIIPSSVTSIGYYAFEGCSGLTSVTIPSSVTSIGGRAFEGCSSLTSVTIPEGVTSIGGRAFEGCSSLTSVTIGNGVTFIGNYAFNCANLTKVVSLIEEPFAISSNVFCQDTKMNADLFVPSGIVDKYKSTDGWKEFMFIQDIENMMDGIEAVRLGDVKEISRYTLNGSKLESPQRGINIIKMSDGTAKKVIVK